MLCFSFAQLRPSSVCRTPEQPGVHVHVVRSADAGQCKGRVRGPDERFGRRVASRSSRVSNPQSQALGTAGAPREFGA